MQTADYYKNLCVTLLVLLGVSFTFLCYFAKNAETANNIINTVSIENYLLQKELRLSESCDKYSLTIYISKISHPPKRGWLPFV